jgi:hypothetical protein
MKTFKLRHDGYYVVDPGKQHPYMLLFPSGKPDGWKMERSELPTPKAERMTEDQLRVALGFKTREREALDRNAKTGKKSGPPSGDINPFNMPEVIHRTPLPGSGLMPCCGKTPFEVPRYHRLGDDSNFTCGVVDGDEIEGEVSLDE